MGPPHRGQCWDCRYLPAPPTWGLSCPVLSSTGLRMQQGKLEEGRSQEDHLQEDRLCLELQRPWCSETHLSRTGRGPTARGLAANRAGAETGRFISSWERSVLWRINHFWAATGPESETCFVNLVPGEPWGCFSRSNRAEQSGWCRVTEQGQPGHVVATPGGTWQQEVRSGQNLRIFRKSLFGLKVSFSLYIYTYICIHAYIFIKNICCLITWQYKASF